MQTAFFETHPGGHLISDSEEEVEDGFPLLVQILPQSMCRSTAVQLFLHGDPASMVSLMCDRVRVLT